MNGIQRIVSDLSNGCRNDCRSDCRNNCQNNYQHRCQQVSPSNCQNNNQHRQSACSCSCSCLNSNHQNTSSTNLNAEKTANQFYNEYYRNVSNVGWNTVMHLFDPNCIVICKDKVIGTEYDMLNQFTRGHVRRANYDTINYKWAILTNEMIMVNVFGQIQFVSFNGVHSEVLTFAETFVLKLTENTTNGEIKCVHHILDF